MSKRNPWKHLGIDWQAMKVGILEYKGTAKGAKANACRASKEYAPKKWRSFKAEGKVWIERLA